MISWSDACTALGAFITCEDPKPGAPLPQKKKNIVVILWKFLIPRIRMMFALIFWQKCMANYLNLLIYQSKLKKTIYEVFYEFQMGDSTFTSKAGSADTHLGDRASCPALITSLKALVTAVEHDWVLNSFTSEFPKSAGIRAMIAAIGEWPTGRDAVLG